ncbi:MAG: GNAT family N-acetyltransferase [Candidatus Hermodarchaeota archaeon]
MKVYFRELTIADIPAIKDISKDIWEGDDYVPHVIDEWLQDKKSMNYGTFKDKNKTDLIGFGRVKLYNNELAWLEGGRIKVSYQGQGIGKKQLGYAVEYAAKSGVKLAQYDTGSDNFASISLAKFYGFTQKKCMDLVIVKSDEIKLSEKIDLNINELTAEKARKKYKEFDIGPGEEICIGWSFIPLKYVTNKHGSWIYNKQAILQKIEFGKSHEYELPSEEEIWMIVYGNPKGACNLILYTIQKELESKKTVNFEVFCKHNVADLIKEMGFHYHEDKRFGVLLFEKAFN